MCAEKRRVITISAATGIVASLALLAFYLVLVGLSSRSWQHSFELLTQDRYYVAAIAAGFGTQVALFSYVRRVGKMVRARRAGAVAATGTGTSTISMVACCLHHTGDILPVVAASGATVFLEQYRYPVMWAGIAVNILGVYLMLRLIGRNGLWPAQVWSVAGPAGAGVKPHGSTLW